MQPCASTRKYKRDRLSVTFSMQWLDKSDRIEEFVKNAQVANFILGF